MKIKKLILGAFLGVFTLAGVAMLPNYANAQEVEPGDGVGGWKGNWWYAASTEKDTAFSETMWFNIKWSKWYTEDYWVAWTEWDQWDALISVIRSAINWVLGMLSLISLALVLYAGFLMVTSQGDSKKYEQGFGIMKWAGIGLAVIAGAWLIVSLIFWIITGSISGWGVNGDNEPVQQ